MFWQLAIIKLGVIVVIERVADWEYGAINNDGDDRTTAMCLAILGITVVGNDASATASVRISRLTFTAPVRRRSNPLGRTE